MNEMNLLSEIDGDLRRSSAQIVIYLEGRTDPNFFFALLGVPIPLDELHQNVVVKGLKDEGSRRGSGSEAVLARVELASRKKLRGVYGVTDGDGRALGELAQAFDAPHSGPMFIWKGYCIENLLAKTGWPAAWGDEPDWPVELAKYGPSMALNRIGSEARAILRRLGLMNFLRPELHTPLKSSTEIASALKAGKDSLLSFDVEQRFADELSAFEARVRRNLDEAHALIDGKWIVRHLAPTLTKRKPDDCEYEWLAHARSVGGLPEVRDWWERVTGNPP
jgi:hypothetical protein